MEEIIFDIQHFNNISNSKKNSLVSGTANADSIVNSGANVTITGGKGNDTIQNKVTSGVLYQYAKGDGNDYISGWTAKDTLTITGGAFTTSTTGNNVVVSVTGGSKITLEGAKGKSININNVGKSISNNAKAKKVTLATEYNDTVKNNFLHKNPSDKKLKLKTSYKHSNTNIEKKSF